MCACTNYWWLFQYVPMWSCFLISPRPAQRGGNLQQSFCGAPWMKTLISKKRLSGDWSCYFPVTSFFGCALFYVSLYLLLREQLVSGQEEAVLTDKCWTRPEPTCSEHGFKTSFRHLLGSSRAQQNNIKRWQVRGLTAAAGRWSSLFFKRRTR